MGRNCRGRNRGCNCNNCMPKCPPKCPTGPTGATGATGATGPGSTVAQELQKFSGSATLRANAPIENLVVSYLADTGYPAILGGVGLSVGDITLAAAPNYPLIEPTTFDALTVNLRSLLAAAIPAALEVTVALVKNSGTVTALQVVYAPGTIAPTGTQLTATGLVTISPTDTYDIRVALRNTGVTPIAVDLVLLLSANLRISA